MCSFVSSKKAAGKVKKSQKILTISTASERITNRLIRNEVISEDDRDIYQYGMEQLLSTSLMLVAMVILGMALGEGWQCLLLVMAFKAIRIYAGGYHASTQRRCFLLSTLVTIAALSVIKFFEIDYFICFGLWMLSSVLILVLSPVEALNKPLDEIENMIFRRRTILVWGVEAIIIVVFAFLKLSQISVCIAFAQIVLGASLIVGKIDLWMHREVVATKKHVKSEKEKQSQ